MKRLTVVAALLAAALVAVAVAALVDRGSDGGKTVATVSGQRITRDDLELAVEHFHEEADREGRSFPAKGTKNYDRVEKLALRLLIDRAAIESAAERLGVHVTEGQVDARLTAGSGGESDEGPTIRVKAETAFRRATARVQLITEGVSRELTGGIRVEAGEVRAYYLRHRSLYGSTPFARVAPAIRSQLLASRKNDALARWLAEVRRSEPKA